MAAFAEHEAKRISQRTKDALAVAKSCGVVLGKAGANTIGRVIEQAAPAVEARCTDCLAPAEGFDANAAVVKFG